MASCGLRCASMLVPRKRDSRAQYCVKVDRMFNISIEGRFAASLISSDRSGALPQLQCWKVQSLIGRYPVAACVILLIHKGMLTFTTQLKARTSYSQAFLCSTGAQLLELQSSTSN